MRVIATMTARYIVEIGVEVRINYATIRTDWEFYAGYGTQDAAIKAADELTLRYKNVRVIGHEVEDT